MASAAALAELEESCPWEKASFRADLALLSDSTATVARLYAADARVVARLAAQVPRCPFDETGSTPWTSFQREIALARKLTDRAAGALVRHAVRLVAVAAPHAGAAGGRCADRPAGRGVPDRARARRRRPGRRAGRRAGRQGRAAPDLADRDRGPPSRAAPGPRQRRAAHRGQERRPRRRAAPQPRRPGLGSADRTGRPAHPLVHHPGHQSPGPESRRGPPHPGRPAVRPRDQHLPLRHPQPRRPHRPEASLRTARGDARRAHEQPAAPSTVQDLPDGTRRTTRHTTTHPHPHPHPTSASPTRTPPPGCDRRSSRRHRSTAG